MYNLYCETLKSVLGSGTYVQFVLWDFKKSRKNKYCQKWPYTEQINQLISVNSYIARYNRKGCWFELGVMQKPFQEFVSWSIIIDVNFGYPRLSFEVHCLIPQNFPTTKQICLSGTKLNSTSDRRGCEVIATY